MFQVTLINQCKNNDRKAQLKLYKQYCDAMFCVSLRYLKNTQDAEDVTQEAFINAFQKIEQYKSEVTFGAWLKKIVIHKCLDFLKQKKARFVDIEEGHLYLAEEEDWNVAASITIAEVKSTIEKLSDKYQCILKLFLIEGYDHGEISQILEISEVASRTRLLRGKQKLKELLNQQRNGTGS